MSWEGDQRDLEHQARASSWIDGRKKEKGMEEEEDGKKRGTGRGIWTLEEPRKG